MAGHGSSGRRLSARGEGPGRQEPLHCNPNSGTRRRRTRVSRNRRRSTQSFGIKNHRSRSRRRREYVVLSLSFPRTVCVPSLGDVSEANSQKLRETARGVRNALGGFLQPPRRRERQG